MPSASRNTTLLEIEIWRPPSPGISSTPLPEILTRFQDVSSVASVAFPVEKEAARSHSITESSMRAGQGKSISIAKASRVPA